jgi:hypothetical protein
MGGASVRAARSPGAKPHAFHRLAGLYRLLGVTAASLLLAIVAQHGERSWALWRELSLFAFVAALVSMTIAPRLDPTIRGVRRAVLADALLFAWYLERSGFHGPFFIFLLLIITVNAASVAGFVPAMGAAATMLLSSGLFHLVLRTPFDPYTSSGAAYLFVGVALAVYLGLVLPVLPLHAPCAAHP